MSSLVTFFTNTQSLIENTSIATRPKVSTDTGIACFTALYGVVGLFLISQVIVFGMLYLFFGKVVVIGFIASIIAGLGTGIGALPVLWFKKVSNDLFNSLLGGAAGVMLAATAFCLSPDCNTVICCGQEKAFMHSLGMIIGALFLHYADKQLPHIHFDSPSDTQLTSFNKIWLFIMAITIHNFPEGDALLA
jgi:ZIP family zinc transporter